jgi:hypothetical protein
MDYDMLVIGYRRRGRDRTDPYRPGGDQSRWHRRFLRPTLAEAYKIAGLDAWNRMGRG